MGNDSAFERDLTAKVELSDRGNRTLHLTLTNKDDPSGYTINEYLLQEGWCRVEDRPNPKLNELYDKLRSAEEIAKQNRVNLWEYGDVSDEESDDEGAPTRKREDGRPPQKK